MIGDVIKDECYIVDVCFVFFEFCVFLVYKEKVLGVIDCEYL